MIRIMDIVANKDNCCFLLLPKLIIVAKSTDMPTADTIKYLYVEGKIDVGTHHQAKKKDKIDQDSPKNKAVEIFFWVLNLSNKEIVKIILNPPIKSKRTYLLSLNVVKLA